MEPIGFAMDRRMLLGVKNARRTRGARGGIAEADDHDDGGLTQAGAVRAPAEAGDANHSTHAPRA